MIFKGTENFLSSQCSLIVNGFLSGIHNDLFFDPDIALITLPEPFLLSKCIQPICLPKDSFDINSKDVEKFTITGLGITDTGNHPDEILYANVDKLNSDKCFEDWECTQDFPRNWKDQKKQGFCSKGKNGEVTLPGDSGGPTVWKDKSGRAYIIGVLSKSTTYEYLCNIPANQQHRAASITSTVSKEISKWIEKNSGKEVDDCQSVADLISYFENL